MKQTKNTKTSVMERVRQLAMNLWWTWNHDAQRLFASMDPATWAATHHNPIRMMELLPPERREALETDEAFVGHLARCERALDEYLSARSWFGKTLGRDAQATLKA